MLAAAARGRPSQLEAEALTRGEREVAGDRRDAVAEVAERRAAVEQDPRCAVVGALDRDDGGSGRPGLPCGALPKWWAARRGRAPRGALRRVSRRSGKLAEELRARAACEYHNAVLATLMESWLRRVVRARRPDGGRRRDAGAPRVRPASRALRAETRYTPPMSFGRNPHVPKAQAAEQKAAEAPDDLSWARAWYEAAHEWERAARREKPGKRRDEHERNAASARARASAPRGEEPAAVDDDASEPADGPDDEDRASAMRPFEAPADESGVVIGLFSGRVRRDPEA